MCFILDNTKGKKPLGKQNIKQSPGAQSGSDKSTGDRVIKDSTPLLRSFFPFERALLIVLITSSHL